MIQQVANKTTKLALFCKVVDNFGDIGICWRLARQLCDEHKIAVTLWVDDLISFQKICPEVKIDLRQQFVQSICIHHWHSQDEQFQTEEIADIVIEFFGCDIPPDYIATMAKCEPKPVWINLEGLTAEEWVEGCHTLPSSHPQYPLTKYFFFPGFTSNTGGLLRENNIASDYADFQKDPGNRLAFLSSLGLSHEEAQGFTVSLFCYPHAPVEDLLRTWEASGETINCLIPVGVAKQAVHNFLQEEALTGLRIQRDNLNLRIIPFIPQQAYDQLLWSCDLNFVRGEDSFVRAQWAQTAFIWHIYPQDENLHHKKLRAFLAKHLATTPASKAFSLAWNDASANPNWADLWKEFRQDLPKIRTLSAEWQAEMQDIGDMTSNLLSFINTKR
ncbi:elongation factor P maturation arginine rhamnosyltransferase EarP [Undibacterium fentianense]|uniref:Protein-arginine rhamnosyltransferase n=1 Tax=Undibacterium fentianense TaxID=2828728 RepID=A0A941E0U4_9BURK|nr:elongation factor P maturation arginine rhamnosyltransferase EarP [Undibacterium fentianense]MBR7799281.1 elongation factor P maturation arginine rhamnosyltransferase EarP [Undibacterium fentianense]